jgi:hypothetical protein
MQMKSFTTAGVVSLFGSVLWLGASAACGGSDAATTPSGDAGNADTGTSSGATSSGSTSSSGGVLEGGTDPNTVPGVAVTYGKCDTFTKCDGSIVGDYKITGGCLPDTTFDEYKKACAGLNVHDVVIKADGTVDATADHVTRNTSIFVQARADIDKANCAGLALVSPGKDPKDFDCTQIGIVLTSGLGGPKFDHAQCVQGPGTTCNCLADATVKEVDDVSKYTTDGTGTLTTTTDTGTNKRTFDYCPKGTDITYHETTDQNPTFGMFLTISKQ